jgi:hypothetical protein
LDTKNWKYCSSKNGAWKPRAPAGVRRISASRGRTGSGRKRKVVTEPQGEIPSPVRIYIFADTQDFFQLLKVKLGLLLVFRLLTVKLGLIKE